MPSSIYGSAIGCFFILLIVGSMRNSCRCGIWAAGYGINPPIASMLETIAIVLVVLWLLGLVSSYTLGGYIHILLVIALVVVLIRIIRGKDPLK
jgi:hypothetical protein